MMTRKTKYLLKLIGIGIFLYILLKIDYKVVRRELINTNLLLLVLALIFFILEIIAKSLRWGVILNSLGINESKKEAIKLYWAGLYLGIVTPSKIGELIKVYFLKLRNHSPFRSLLSIIIDRMIDVVTLLILGLLITLFALKEISNHLLILGGSLMLGMLFIFLLLDPKSSIHRFGGKLLGKFSSFNFKEYDHFNFKKLCQGIKSLKKDSIKKGALYWLISWSLYFLARYLIALALNINISFINTAIISIAFALVSILPFSIAGLGTRDATSIYLFSLFGFSKEIALLFSMFILIIDLLSISIGVIAYFKESNRIKSIKYEFTKPE